MEKEFIIGLFIGIILMLGWGVKILKKDGLIREEENFKLWKENRDLKKSNSELLEASNILAKKIKNKENGK